MSLSTGHTLSRSLPHPRASRPTAVVYCEANFGQVDGKTANGLVRHSDRYEIVAVIDGQRSGADAGMVLDGAANDIPIRQDLDAALAQATTRPDFLIFGIAPASGTLSTTERALLLDAMSRGLGIVNGLHEFLNDDPEFAAAAAINGVQIIDVRRPRAAASLRTFTGRIHDVTCPRIAVLGTDCAIGKRTTATVLTRALNDRGVHAVMVGTGQTGLIQGARFGVALDAVPAQFGAGELEAVVVEAFEAEHPDVIIVEGQGALSHPAYSSSAFILRGSCPQGVVLQHAPGRAMRCDFPTFAMPTPSAEIALIESFTSTRVIGLTLNHEHLDDIEVEAAITRYAAELGLPVTDALMRPPDRLVDMVVDAFPEMRRKLTAAVT